MDKVQFNTNNLWHYTTSGGLMGILESQRLWATDYRHLNDSSELNHARYILQTELFQRVIHLIGEECCNKPEVKKYIDQNGGVNHVAAEESKETIDIIWEGLMRSSPLSTIPCILSFCLCEIENKNKQRDGLLYCISGAA